MNEYRQDQPYTSSYFPMRFQSVPTMWKLSEMMLWLYGISFVLSCTLCSHIYKEYKVKFSRQATKESHLITLSFSHHYHQHFHFVREKEKWVWGVSPTARDARQFSQTKVDILSTNARVSVSYAFYNLFELRYANSIWMLNELKAGHECTRCCCKDAFFWNSVRCNQEKYTGAATRFYNCLKWCEDAQFLK